MKLSIAFSWATCAALASAIPTQLGVYDDRLDVIGITYNGPVRPGGSNHTIHGTVEQIYSQILKLNPSFNSEDFDETKSSSIESYKQEFAASMKNKARKRGTHLNCNPQGESCRLSKVPEPLNTLYKMPGLCGAPKGWGGCSRLSCSWGAGIALCNDNPTPFSVACRTVAMYASHTAQECGSHIADLTKGQLFDDGKWNVIVKWYPC